MPSLWANHSVRIRFPRSFPAAAPRPGTASAAETKNYGRTGSGRKWLALAALVVVISVVLTGFFLGSDYLKNNWIEVIKGKVAHKAPVAVKKQAGVRHRVSIQPIIGFKVNVPIMLDNLEAQIPEGTTQPTFFLQWNQVYMKQLNGRKLKYLPRDYYNTGWVEVKFMGT